MRSGHKQGKGFGKRAAHRQHPIFLGVPLGLERVITLVCHYGVQHHQQCKLHLISRKAAATRKTFHYPLERDHPRDSGGLLLL